MKRFLWTFSIFIILISNLQAASNSQWRGQNRDGIYHEKNLMKKWPAEGPKLLWSTKDIGKGYTSVAVASDRVYVTGMMESTGYVFTYDLNGTLLWKAAYGPEWDGSRPGTRSAPTVIGDHLYVMSGQGRAVCLDAVKGRNLGSGSGRTIWCQESAMGPDRISACGWESRDLYTWRRRSHGCRSGSYVRQDGLEIRRKW